MSDIFKIVKIIDDSSVVINAGSSHGVKRGDELQVFVVGEEILDIDTGESLGTLDTIKARLEIKEVYEKMSLCVNAETTTVSNFIYTNPFSKTTRLPLNVDMTQAEKVLVSENKLLKIGDLVRKAL